LFVHPNTVRYRLRRIADFTGRDPTVPRDAYVLRVASTVGRLNRQTHSTGARLGGTARHYDGSARPFGPGRIGG